MRKKIDAGDKDIGQYLEADITDPRLRQVLYIIQRFVDGIKNGNIDVLKEILSPSAYNSYILRFSEKQFKEDYILRVAYSEKYSENIFEVKYKILFKNKSIIGTVELDFTKDSPIISDFDPNAIDEIFTFFEKK